jgi:hypothetical protein
MGPTSCSRHSSDVTTPKLLPDRLRSGAENRARARLPDVTDPSARLAERVAAAAVAAFGQEHAGVDPMVRRSDHADYQANLARELGRMLADERLGVPIARIRSILRRAGGAPAMDTPPKLTAAPERELALQLLQLGSAVELVARELEPHHLCTCLFGVATRFSTFYEQCPVLKAEGEVRASRIALCGATALVLAQGLSLPGIEAPEQL